MKRAVAIILSLTVIWLQMLAAAQTLSTPTPDPQCACCAGQRVCCCVAEAATDAIPVPVAPASVPATTDFHAVLARLVAWTLPAPAPALVSPSDSSSVLAPAVPLFQRNCALLI
jgi:hypothetical protein